LGGYHPCGTSPCAASVGGVSIGEEIQASAAAHRELGPGYDTAVAEGLVERIGEEIDKRIDARLITRLQDREPCRAPAHARVGFTAMVLALGSMGLGIGATAAVLHPAPGTQLAQGPIIGLIWIVIAIINIAYSRRH
jgi:hypothetical protein